MSPEEWLNSRKLGWCRSQTWMTAEACQSRKLSVMKGYRGLHDENGGMLVGCDSCSGLDFSRERGIAPDPFPRRAEPLAKPAVVKRKSKAKVNAKAKSKPAKAMVKAKVVKKSHRLCVVDGCSKFRQYGCKMMCKAHFDEIYTNKGVGN